MFIVPSERHATVAPKAPKTARAGTRARPASIIGATSVITGVLLTKTLTSLFEASKDASVNGMITEIMSKRISFFNI